MSRSIRAACAIVVAAASLAATSTAAEAKTLDIVIAGDSYSSGVGGGGPISGGTCIRSPYTWGNVYAGLVRQKGITVTVKNVACGGGVVPDLDGQMAAVTPQTDLVLLTIGGNDVGFANIVVQCFTPALADPARCQQAISAGKKKVPGVKVAALKRLQALRAKMRPGAKIAVASYPYLANPNNYILRGLFNWYNTGKGARELGDLGDKIVLESAAEVNAEAGYDLLTFIPTKDRFVGREPNQDPYAENPNRWVNEFDLAGPYHPNNKGYRAMADATLVAAGPTFDFGVSE